MDDMRLIKLLDRNESSVFFFFYTDASFEAVQSVIDLVKSQEDQDDDYMKIKEILEVSGYVTKPHMYETFEA